MTTEVEVLTRGQLDEVVKLLAKSTRKHITELLDPIRAEIKELREEIRGENERALKLSDELDAVEASLAGVHTQFKVLDERTDATDDRAAEYATAWTDALARIENKFQKHSDEIFNDMRNVTNVLTGLDARTKQIEERPPPRDGKDGVNGKDGAPGRDGIDGRNGTDGKDGAPGLNGKDGRDGVDGAKGRDGEPGRDGAAGRDGLPGRDGKDGTAGVDGKAGRDGTDGLNGKDGSDGINGKDGEPGRDGKDGSDGAPGRDGADGLHGKDGKDGTDGAPGRDGTNGIDGFNFDDVTFEQIGPRTVRATFARGDVQKTLDMKLSYPLYVGVYKHDRDTPYEQGDVVTINGSMYVAMENAPEGRPGMPTSKGWKLAVKNGKDGRDGNPGERGKQGEPGRAGRDLTSMAPDGRRF